MPVHLFGNPFDVDAMLAIAKKHNVALIEDACQAQGAEYDGRALGRWGDLGCFSFSGKQMTTGEGGMVITDRDDLAHRLKWFADKGNPRRPHYEHYYLAPNYKMSELQGAVGIAQLRKVGEVFRRKRAAAAYLNEIVDSTEGLRTLRVLPKANPVYWVYGFQIDPQVIRVPVSDFAAALQAEGLPVNAPYLEKPIYQYPALTEPHLYGTSRYPLDAFNAPDYASLRLPGLDEFRARTAVLTMNPSFTEAQVEHFGRAIQDVAARLRTH
jgi:dTDP-4-amino-4,6-dideoxygalactose transaminase